MLIVEHHVAFGRAELAMTELFLDQWRRHSIGSSQRGERPTEIVGTDFDFCRFFKTLESCLNTSFSKWGAILGCYEQIGIFPAIGEPLAENEL